MIMASSAAPPILTNVDSTYLECTLHSAKYHCLLRLRSRNVGGNDSAKKTSTSSAAFNLKSSNAVMAMPDISSLSVIPISADRINTARSSTNNQSNAIHLLPKLYNATTHTHDGKRGKRNDVETADDSVDNDTLSITHPSRELVRITRDLEAHLKERLKDAADGAMHDNSADRNIDPTHPSGMHEDFLRRSEAILQELISAVQQQVRKEQSNRGGSGASTSGNGHNKKRKATDQATTITSTMIATPPLTYYSALVRQLQVLQSMPNVTDISLHKNSSTTDQTPADLTTVSVTCLDRNKRSHTWHAELYPSIVLTVDLPSEFALDDKHIRLEKWWEGGANASTLDGGTNDGSGTLPRIHHQFEQALERYQPLFDELDDLDSHLWILEPSLPARRCSVERRIALWEGGASMVIMLDPENCRGIPVMVRFLGVTIATMKAVANAAATSGPNGETSGSVVDWRTSFAEFVSEEEDGKINSTISQTKTGTADNEPMSPKRWSEERSVRENLELWFGSALPSPLSPSKEKSDFLVECGICYAHRLPTEDEVSEEGPLPEAKCGNPSCNRHYHESCLFEWLHSLPTARVSFDRIFGACPYCCEAVSVKVLNGSNNH